MAESLGLGSEVVAEDWNDVAVIGSLGLGKDLVIEDWKLVKYISVVGWVATGEVIELDVLEEGEESSEFTWDQLNPAGLFGKTEVSFQDLLLSPS